jgi:hypothetical protein
LLESGECDLGGCGWGGALVVVAEDDWQV